ncbi:MAG: deoxyguanosinetriphosphate triphosphohydrolase, partial [Gemmatimonadetes bacterium]|nr:deoxyguanosinetriphosphate triphosphohydrolase [Gemmatimonadota bacterium]NIV82417.1 deoxyguanosinetriphosphate triphosphohydrolase [Gemmatimonadota bacterium]NIX39085.1 deoxyguanosinetriphosphate triphosphohydrolase [Gemmatimonadota bacterium]
RDRIIHSTAFRRLEYKTQVFVNHEGDHYRTRLTHTLEVGQIGRSLARVLGVNEDLVEAVALAHDLGHTPFGHAGQTALDRCMAELGGFEHNYQSLRVVDALEQRYAAFPGLNLTFEVREGMIKHCSPARAERLGDVARRFREGTQPSVEAQIANVADEIAYNNHDIDDGLRSGLIDPDQLREQVVLFREAWDEVEEAHPGLGAGRRGIHEVIRRLIDRQVGDLAETTGDRLSQWKCDSPEEVRAAGEPVVAFSPAMARANRELKRFLHRELYRHYRVMRMALKGGRIIEALWGAFMEDPVMLPTEFRQRAEREEAGLGRAGRAVVVADYVAGMTDRYAIREHGRIF